MTTRPWSRFGEFGQVSKSTRQNSKRSQSKARVGAASECVCESRFVPKLPFQCEESNWWTQETWSVTALQLCSRSVITMRLCCWWGPGTLQSWNWQQGGCGCYSQYPSSSHTTFFPPQIISSPLLHQKGWSVLLSHEIFHFINVIWSSTSFIPFKRLFSHKNCSNAILCLCFIYFVGIYEC